jgi:hypothetical protein
MEFMTQMYLNYLEFANNSVSDIDFGKVGYDTYWAGMLGFDKDHKKSVRDGISQVDKELVANSVLTRYSHLPHGKGYTGVCVISPDAHISNTIKVLTDKHFSLMHDYPENYRRFGYDGIKTISSR